MAIDDRTPVRNYQKPNPSNLLSEDVLRLRAALDAIDADMVNRYTKAETNQQIAALVNGAPGTLDTLNELAAALGNDPNYAATIATALGNRYTKAESDARYVQGTTQTEMVFTATLGQTQFTLTTPAAAAASLLVTVDGLIQPTAEYSLNQAGTILTFSEAVPAGSRVRILVLGVAGPTSIPSDDSVTTVKLRNGAVTAEKLAPGAGFNTGKAIAMSIVFG